MEIYFSRPQERKTYTETKNRADPKSSKK